MSTKVSSPAWSEDPVDGHTLAGGAGRQVLLWDCKTKEIIKTFSGHQALVTSLKFSPGGEKLASGSKDQTVRVWDVASGQLQMTLTGHIWPVGCLGAY
ncbi:MAG: hypothetical protein QF918_02925 [Pirellulaceae bacterium]|jgi:WD40 repeat protein|nr:hypothetical protein [Pirellulaceae bacterium]MDP6556042.1 hypothetical protein [Pirellulaceae bacterium]MDP6718780.1 hypothetical protein [Pirellulaceae bacterium]